MISAIISSFTYVAEIFLLYTVYALLTQLNKRVAPRSFLAKLPLIWIHTIFCAFLFVIYLALLALRIAYTVEATLNGDFSFRYSYYSRYSSYYHLVPIRAKINIAYNMLYMVFSIEVLGLAIMTFVRSLKTRATNLKNVCLQYLPLFQVLSYVPD